MTQEGPWVLQVGTHSSPNMHGCFFHRGARNCGEDAVTRECGAECCPISVMKLLPVTIRIELVATVWQHRTSVSELHKS